MTQRLTNVCFTINNPEEELVFKPDDMLYLIYQLELGAGDDWNAGTPHFQGYMELKTRKTLRQIKALLGCNHAHIEQRQGTAEQASAYCEKDETYVEGGQRLKFGTMKETTPGKRNDIKNFADAVRSGTKRKRDLVDEYPGIIARYSHFYENLTLMSRPFRPNHSVEVILHIGETGLGKTRSVMDAHLEDDSFWVAPLSNSTTWFDHYDGHTSVLLDDFAGAASHMSLVMLLRLLDVYPVMVPTKGSHTWWYPDRVYVTTNILPCHWYKWENRGAQYRALERRFAKVVLFYPKLFPEDPGSVLQQTLKDHPENWWKENAPQEALQYYNA